MKSDKSRETFRPDKHYSSVRLQQGRVLTDADWNEQSDIIEYRNEITTQDVIGQSGVPVPPNGFDVGASTTNANDYTLSNGRIYVDGILAENNLAGTTYLNQPYPFFDVGAATGNFDPTNPPPPPAPQSSGVVVAYVDVWQRHIDVIDDPTIREVALGGPDTATRAQTVWQLKFLDIPNSDSDSVPSDPDSLPAFQELVNPSVPPAMLSAQAEGPPVSTDPCIIPQSAGFRLLENQLYRVEVHTGGSLSADPTSPVFINQGDSTGSLEVTFKWSRDNGSVTVAWLPDPPQAAQFTLTVQLLTTDETKGFSIGDWVELTDDSRDLSGVSGVFVKLTNVLGNTLTYDSTNVEDPINGNSLPILRGLDSNHPRVRRWDMRTPPMAVTRDDSDANGGFVNLEAGVQVLFGAGTYKPGDYWEIPARTISGGVEWPLEADGTTPQPLPPFGIKHHYACLTAFHQPNFTEKEDCRKLFKPLTEVNVPTQDDPVTGQFRYYLLDNSIQDDTTGVVGIANDSVTALGLALPFKTLLKVAQIFPRDGHDSSAIVLIKAALTPYDDFTMFGVHGYKKIVIRGSTFDFHDPDPTLAKETLISGAQPVSGFEGGVLLSANSVANRIFIPQQLDASSIGQRVRFAHDTRSGGDLADACSMILNAGVTTLPSGGTSGFIDLSINLDTDFEGAVTNDHMFLEEPGVTVNLTLGISDTGRGSGFDNDGTSILSIVGLNGNLVLSGPLTAEIAFCQSRQAAFSSFGGIRIDGTFDDENNHETVMGAGLNGVDTSNNPLVESFFEDGLFLGLSNVAANHIGVNNVSHVVIGRNTDTVLGEGFFANNIGIDNCHAYTIGQDRVNSSAPFLVRLGTVNVSESDGAIRSAQLNNSYSGNSFDPVGTDPSTSIIFQGVGRSLTLNDFSVPNLNGISGVILDARGAVASRFVYDPLMPVATVVSGIFQLPGASMFRPFELSVTDVIDSSDNHYFSPTRSFAHKGIALKASEAILRYAVTQYTPASVLTAPLSGEVQTARCQGDANRLAASIAGISQQEILGNTDDLGVSLSMHVTTGYSVVRLASDSVSPPQLPIAVFLSDTTNGAVTITPPVNNPVVRIGVMVRVLNYGDNDPNSGTLALVRLQLDQTLNPTPLVFPSPPPVIVP